jgi:hypothetical protein
MDDADRRLAEIVARKHASDQKKAAEQRRKRPGGRSRLRKRSWLSCQGRSP